MPHEHAPDLSAFSEPGLFCLYRAILRELKGRGVIRTENAPAGDYAEYLVAAALGGQLAPNSEKSWDVLAEHGEKLQVKTRVVSDPPEPGQLQLSPFRSFGFDSAVIVLLSDADYAVSRASKVPRHVVESSAVYRQHVNGRVAALSEEVGLRTPAKVVAARLRATGWLLPTGQRGIYEFAPGAHAGPYGHGDPFIDLRAAVSAGHVLTVALQSALWLHGLAERAPDRHELAAPPGSAVPVSVRRRMRIVRFSARLPTAQFDQLPVHRAATILVHLAARPGDVRGWTTFAEALPELAARSTADDVEQELGARPGTVRPRLAYLLSGVAPALADRLQPTKPSSVTWFGSSRASRRYDKRFSVADGLLPFDPRTLQEPA